MQWFAFQLISLYIYLMNIILKFRISKKQQNLEIGQYSSHTICGVIRVVHNDRSHILEIDTSRFPVQEGHA